MSVRPSLGFLGVGLTVIVVMAIGAPIVLAEEGDASEEDLARKTQNPVSDLISLPFQNNFNFKVGPEEKTQYLLNIQPVYPVSLNEDWNLITRTIIPVISQPELIPGDGRTDGLGDINFAAFVSPAQPGQWIWGVGPALLFPSATDDVLGSDEWAAGPSVVILTMPGNWVIGSLFSNVWSYAGSGDEDVDLFTWQYFVNYNLPDGWYLTSPPIITANWEASSSNRWTVPIGGGIGKIHRIGKLPVNFQVQGFYNVEEPEYGAEWTLRFQA